MIIFQLLTSCLELCVLLRCFIHVSHSFSTEDSHGTAFYSMPFTHSSSLLWRFNSFSGSVPSAIAYFDVFKLMISFLNHFCSLSLHLNYCFVCQILLCIICYCLDLLNLITFLLPVLSSVSPTFIFLIFACFLYYCSFEL